MDLQSWFLMTSTRRYLARSMTLQAGQFSYQDEVPEQPVPLYIHIPFCESLCPFCPFHRIILDKSLASEYLHYLTVEVNRLHRIGFKFNQVYVGGGTPTTMVKELVILLHKIQTYWPIKDISVETNPNHLSMDILGPLKEAGVTRLSVGVQSLDNETLKRIGRYHAYGGRDEIIHKLGNIQGEFETFDVDMIFNLPQQTEHEIKNDIVALKALAIDQITYYPLMPVLANNYKRAIDFTTINFKQEKYLYRMIVEQLTPDYQMSSVWCFNKKMQLGDEYIVSSDKYLGIGSGSFSLLANHIYAATFNIPQYIAEIAQEGVPWQARQALSNWQLQQYKLLTRLFGLTIPVEMADLPKFSLQVMLWLGAIEKKQTVYQLTEKGRYWWLIMMREFFMAVNRYRRQLGQ